MPPNHSRSTGALRIAEIRRVGIDRRFLDPERGAGFLGELDRLSGCAGRSSPPFDISLRS